MMYGKGRTELATIAYLISLIQSYWAIIACIISALKLFSNKRVYPIRSSINTYPRIVID